jgi:hypothetical protein
MHSRGPTAQRGLQFSRAAVPELLEALASAKTKLQQMEDADDADLRAELRRRNI